MYLENEKNVFIFVTPLQIEFKHMGQNMFLFFVLNFPNRVVKHWGMKKNINFRCSFKIPVRILELWLLTVIDCLFLFFSEEKKIPVQNGPVWLSWLKAIHFVNSDITIFSL